MWIFFNDCWFSIVHKDCAPHELLVRARRAGDIEKLWPSAMVTEVAQADYQFRATLTRSAVGEALVREVDNISYPNFKNSVRDHKLATYYARVWDTMGGGARMRSVASRMADAHTWWSR